MPVYDISQLADLSHFAQQLAAELKGINWVYLNGDLGCGKTTFSQYFIAAKGYSGRVTSPTYAIMQDYHTATGCVIHCDLYRLADPEELYEIGLLEMAEDNQAIVLLEWPEKGRGVIPLPDIQLDFSLNGQQRSLRGGLKKGFYFPY